jgi:hypothetical protein
VQQCRLDDINIHAIAFAELRERFGNEQVSNSPYILSRERQKMMFTIEFFRIRKEDNARAMLDRITHIASDLESAKVKAKSLFETLNMPQNPDGLRILDQNGHEVFFWTQRTEGS